MQDLRQTTAAGEMPWQSWGCRDTPSPPCWAQGAGSRTEGIKELFLRANGQRHKTLCIYEYIYIKKKKPRDEAPDALPKSPSK